MVDSLSSWLALREPADVAARSVPLTRAIADVLPRGRPLCVLDLATGSGSNIRYLADHLSGQQSWLPVDHDAALLAELPARMAAWGAARAYEVAAETGEWVIRGSGLQCHVAEPRRLDLAALADGTIFAGRHLVTASALLDLVSATWLRALAARCRENGAAALFALTYNGQSSCVPVEPEDDTIRLLMNRHQKTDKGFGAAAGPDATDDAARCFAALGYRVRREPSDWVLPPDARELQRRLIEGWAEAAAEIAPERSAVIENWLGRRLAHVSAGRSQLTVGHEDLAAWLPTPPAGQRNAATSTSEAEPHPPSRFSRSEAEPR